ncbi:MAG TPA: EamA family transporter [Polyangia bacterium]|nr:EamA family transporter [Polyangia bacterium]
MDSRARRAALQLVGSSVLFAVMAMATKEVARRVPGPQAAMIRFAAGVIAAVVGTLVGHVRIRPRRWGWLLTRGLFGGIAVLTYFMCIQRVPVGVATLLNQTQPVYTMLFAWLLLRERPTRAAVVALPLSAAGVVLIVGVRVAELHAGWGETLGIISAVTSGVAVTAIRAARRDHADGRPGDSAWSVFFSFTALGFLVTAPAALPPFGTWLPPTPAEWGLLAVVGVAGVSAQLIMTDALRHIGGATAGIIAQLVVLLTMAGGAIIFGDRITLSLVIGGALTLTGVALVIGSSGSAARPPVNVIDD